MVQGQIGDGFNPYGNLAGLAPPRINEAAKEAKSFNPFDDADVSARAMAVAPTHKARRPNIQHTSTFWHFKIRFKSQIVHCQVFFLFN